MSYCDPNTSASPTHSSIASQKSSPKYPRNYESWKNGNEMWRGGNNWRKPTYFGPRFEHGGTGGYRGHGSFIAPKYEPCDNCAGGTHPRWKCLYYDRICSRCFKLGHSPDYCRSRSPIVGVSFYHDVCYFSTETITKLANVPYDSRREEIKCMYNILTQDEVSVISLAMEMQESDESRRARCFRCRDFHSSRICWYSGRQCSLCGNLGHAEVVCSNMALPRKNCQYHYPYFSSNDGQVGLLPQEEASPYAPQSEIFNEGRTNVMEPQYPPSWVTETVDTTKVSDSNWDCSDPVDQSWAGPDPVDTSWAGPDPVDTSWAGPDPVDTSWAGPETVDTNWAGPDPVNTSYADPDLVDKSCNVPDSVDSRCAAPNQGDESPAVAAPTDPKFGTEGSTSSNHAAGDPTNFNGDADLTSVPSVAVDKPEYQNEDSVESTKSNEANLDWSSCEPVCTEPVTGQGNPSMSHLTVDEMSSCSGETVNSTMENTTTLSDIQISSSVPAENHLSPCEAVTCGREERSCTTNSAASASSGSTSDDAYITAEECNLSREHSDTEITSKSLPSTTKSGSDRNDSHGQNGIDALPQSTLDYNSSSKVELSVDASEEMKNGLPVQGNSTEQHQSDILPPIHVTDSVDETVACSPIRMVSGNVVNSSKKNRKKKFPPETVLPPCSRCLSRRHLPENCRRKEDTCYRCQSKGHIKKACSEPNQPSSKNYTKYSPSYQSRARGIDSIRKEEAARRSSFDSDSGLPPPPLTPASPQDLPPSSATSSASHPEKPSSDTSPSNGSNDSNCRNWRESGRDTSRLAYNTSACSGSNCFKTQEPDQDEEKATSFGPPSQRMMMASDASAGDLRHKQPQHKQRREDQHRYDRPSHQHYSSRGSPKKYNNKHSDLVAAASVAAAAAGSSVRQEPRGTPLASLTRMSAAHPGVPGVAPSRQHEVLVQIPAPQGCPPLPYPPPSSVDDLWDQSHVRMPCSPSSLYARDCLPPGYPDTSSRDTVPRWSVIKWALNQPLKSVDDVQRAIVGYNNRYKDKWLLHGLQAVVREFSGEEKDQFFSSTLPGMCHLALRLPELVTRSPSLLVAHRIKAVTLSQLQIASLLANAFFCTFPRRNARGSDTEYAHFPDINFSRLLNADGPSVLEKIKCLLNYFRVVTTTEPVGLVTFARNMVENAPAVIWQQCTSALPRLHCDDGGLIEEATGLLQVDFANRFLGGGVLGHGCVQEEIRFMLCPELLITRLLAEALDKTEALIVVGVEQYNRGEGYADSFLFAGRHEDTTPRDSFGRRMCQLTAIDAVHFRARPSVQFTEELVIREINKAYAGFCALEGTVGCLPAVATGNWGCGAFRGNPLLKALLQLAACGYAGRDVAYFTFLDAKLKNRIADMHEFLVKGGVTVGALVQCICQYGTMSREMDGSDLYQYLYHNLRDPSRTPSPGDSPRPEDQGPQQTESTFERTSGSSWAAKSREMNGNGNSFNGANSKNGAQNKARGKEPVANNSRVTDFFPRLPKKGPRGDDKNGTGSLTGTGNGSIASVHKTSSSPHVPPSQSPGGFWDDGIPEKGEPAKGSGGRGGKHRKNRGRAKESLTNQQIVDAITEPDAKQEKNADVRREEKGAGAGEEFTPSPAKRGRKKKGRGNRKSVHNVNDGNAINSPVRVSKGDSGLNRNMTTGHDDHSLTSKKGVGCS